MFQFKKKNKTPSFWGSASFLGRREGINHAWGNAGNAPVQRPLNSTMPSLFQQAHQEDNSMSSQELSVCDSVYATTQPQAQPTQLHSSRMPIQRQLVDGSGTPMTSEEIDALKRRKPECSGEIDRIHADMTTDYVPNVTRSGVNFTPFRPASSRSWRWSQPEGFSTSHSGESVYGVAKREGLKMNLKRTSMSSGFTGEILEQKSRTGIEFSGASALESGKGLKESGLARTHHIADSSVRAIIEYLHKDRSWTGSRGSLIKVLNWMKSMTHGLGTSHDLFKLLLNARSTRDLEAVINALSNNEWNVGLGDATINGQVGPMRDASITQSGFPTEQSFLTDFGLAYLRGIVPNTILEAAGAYLIDDKTGEQLYSMKATVTHQGVPAKGRYNASDLTDRQILAMVNQALVRRRVWAVSLVEMSRGNNQEIIARLREGNSRFDVDALGNVYLRLRGG